MKKNKYELITKIDHRLRPDYKDLSPAYVKVIANIKQDNELLLPRGYGCYYCHFFVCVSLNCRVN